MLKSAGWTAFPLKWWKNMRRSRWPGCFPENLIPSQIIRSNLISDSRYILIRYPSNWTKILFWIINHGGGMDNIVLLWFLLWNWYIRLFTNAFVVVRVWKITFPWPCCYAKVRHRCDLIALDQALAGWPPDGNRPSCVWIVSQQFLARTLVDPPSEANDPTI